MIPADSSQADEYLFSSGFTKPEVRRFRKAAREVDGAGEWPETVARAARAHRLRPSDLEEYLDLRVLGTRRYLP